jgi:hypothetical protein
MWEILQNSTLLNMLPICSRFEREKMAFSLVKLKTKEGEYVEEENERLLN